MTIKSKPLILFLFVIYLLGVSVTVGLAQKHEQYLIEYDPCDENANKTCKQNEMIISWNVEHVKGAIGVILTREDERKTKTVITLGTFKQVKGSISDVICDAMTYRVIAIDKKGRKISKATDRTCSVNSPGQLLTLSRSPKLISSAGILLIITRLKRTASAVKTCTFITVSRRIAERSLRAITYAPPANPIRKSATTMLNA